MKNNKINKHAYSYNVLCFSLIGVEFYLSVTGSGYYLYVLLGVFLTCMIMKAASKNIFAIFFTGAFLMLTHYLYIQEAYVGVFLYFVFGVSLGGAFKQNGINNKFAILYSIITYSYYSYLVWLDFAVGLNLNHEVFHSSTANYISVYLILSLALLYFSDANRHVFLFFLCTGAFFIAWSGGRSGAVVYSLLLIYFLFFNSPGPNEGRFAKWVLVGVILFFILYSLEDLAYNVIGKFDRKGLSGDGRENVFGCYISNINVLDIIFGSNTNDMRECFPSNSLNPHNSFVWIHLWFGLGGLISIITLIFYCLLRMIVNKRYDMLVFFLVFILRSMTDIAFLGKSADFLFWFFIFTIMSDYPKAKLKCPTKLSY